MNIREYILQGLQFFTLFLGIFMLLNISGVWTLVDFYWSGEKKEAILTSSLMQDTVHKPLIPSGAKKLTSFQIPPLSLNLTPPDYRIVIPKLGINAPLIEMDKSYLHDQSLWTGFENDVQKALEKGIVHYPGTAMPGQIGNAFFTGHSSYYPFAPGNYKEIFATLNKLNIGDEYIIYYKQRPYVYKITEKKQVRPTEMSVLNQPGNKKISTLMTCWPLGTTLRRLIVVAEQISS